MWLVKERHGGGGEWKSKACGCVKVSSWRKAGSVKERNWRAGATANKSTQRINSRLGSWRAQAKSCAASWYRESDGGYDGLGGQARRAESTENERDAGQLVKCDY
jgi:hypothetical protein